MSLRKYGVTLCPPCRSEELKRHCFLLLQKELAEAWPRQNAKKEGDGARSPVP